MLPNCCLGFQSHAYHTNMKTCINYTVELQLQKAKCIFLMSKGRFKKELLKADSGFPPNRSKRQRSPLHQGTDGFTKASGVFPRNT